MIVARGNTLIWNLSMVWNLFSFRFYASFLEIICCCRRFSFFSLSLFQRARTLSIFRYFCYCTGFSNSHQIIPDLSRRPTVRNLYFIEVLVCVLKLHRIERQFFSYSHCSTISIDCILSAFFYPFQTKSTPHSTIHVAFMAFFQCKIIAAIE